VDDDKVQFQNDLLESVRQMKGDQAARVTQVPLTAAAEARQRVGLSQKEFATLLGVSVRTLQDWEQGRQEPSGAARTLLRIANKNPKAILDAA
jgi:putative transcriptional regulator